MAFDPHTRTGSDTAAREAKSCTFRVSPARLKTLEAIAKIRDKENKILSTSFIILEWSLQRQNMKLTCPTEADSYAPLTEQEYTSGQQGIP
jgi:hypothetical protein